MKSMKKLAALLLALVMTLTLAACGGGKGSSKTNPVVGKYIGETVLSFDEWVPMDEVYDLGDNYIELKEDGTGCFMLDGDPTTIEWKLTKDGALTLDRDGSVCNCTLKDGMIMVNDYFGFDLQLTFRKGEGNISGTSGNTGADEMSLDDFAVTFFTRGTVGLDTLSTYIYTDARKGGLTPELRPLMTIIFLVVLVSLLFINLRTNRAAQKS